MSGHTDTPSCYPLPQPPRPIHARPRQGRQAAEAAPVHESQ